MCFLGLYQHNHRDSVSNLFDTVFTNSADTSIDLAENDIAETGSYHPRFECDFTMPVIISNQYS
jgi:hypothetical protein